MLRLLMEPHLAAGPCKLLLLSINLHPHLLTAFNSEVKNLLERFSCKPEMGIVQSLWLTTLLNLENLNHI